MPLYDFTCRSCGGRAEKRVRMGEYETACEDCGGVAVADEVPQIRELASKKKLGDYANLSSLRFHINGDVHQD